MSKYSWTSSQIAAQSSEGSSTPSSGLILFLMITFMVPSFFEESASLISSQKLSHLWIQNLALLSAMSLNFLLYYRSKNGWRALLIAQTLVSAQLVAMTYASHFERITLTLVGMIIALTFLLFRSQRYSELSILNLQQQIKLQFETSQKNIQRWELNHRLLENAQKLAKIGNWSFDARNRSFSWSKQMFKLFPEDIRSGPPSFDRHLSTIHPEDQGQWLNYFEQCLNDGQLYQFRFRTEIDRNIVWIELKADGIRGPNGDFIGLHGTCQDISQQIEAESAVQYERAKAIQAAKLASLGEMSAGIAHEINNPLAVISGSASLLQKFINQPVKLEKKIEDIQKSCLRISKIVSGLKKFSRLADAPQYSLQSVATIIQEAMAIAEARARHNGVRIEIDLQSDSKINCNSLEIEQVLINLINNAVDAIKSLPDRWVRVAVYENQGNVVIQVTDSGTGITPEICKKIFEPFFTTKKVGEGTGLGLSISFGIIKEHGASLSLLEDSRNTCFEIIFHPPHSTAEAA